MFSQNSVISLKRWLEFRGFQRKGTTKTCKKVRPAVGLNLLGESCPWSGWWALLERQLALSSYTRIQIASQSRTIHVSLTHVNYNYNLPGIKAGNGMVRGS